MYIYITTIFHFSSTTWRSGNSKPLLQNSFLLQTLTGKLANPMIKWDRGLNADTAEGTYDLSSPPKIQKKIVWMKAIASILHKASLRILEKLKSKFFYGYPLLLIFLLKRLSKSWRSISKFSTDCSMVEFILSFGWHNINLNFFIFTSVFFNYLT